MIHKYRGATVPAGGVTPLDQRALQTLERYRRAMDSYLLHQGLAAAMELAGAANVYIEETAPWTLAKDPARASELDAALASLARTLARLAVLLSPFMPVKCCELWHALGRQGEIAGLEAYAALDPAGHTVARQAVLFPKLERVVEN